MWHEILAFWTFIEGCRTDSISSSTPRFLQNGSRDGQAIDLRFRVVVQFLDPITAHFVAGRHAVLFE